MEAWFPFSVPNLFCLSTRSSLQIHFFHGSFLRFTSNEMFTKHSIVSLSSGFWYYLLYILSGSLVKCSNSSILSLVVEFDFFFSTFSGFSFLFLVGGGEGRNDDRVVVLNVVPWLKEFKWIYI